MRKPLKPKRIHERAAQYRMIAERLQLYLENLPPNEIELIRTAQQAYLEPPMQWKRVRASATN
jgi:hypothetical protein